MLLHSERCHGTERSSWLYREAASSMGRCLSCRQFKASRLIGVLLAVCTAISLSLAASGETISTQDTPVYGYAVINEYPHDPEAFTQGLVLEDGTLYEGTGLWGRSSLRRVDKRTGIVMQLRELPSRFFGEGITVLGDRIVQLTWQARVGFVYDRESFGLLQEFQYATEGWGLTHDGEHLIMSDGTAWLHFLHPQTFEEVRRLQVLEDDGPVIRLNELEYIQGEIYANVWLTDRLARIDPLTGQVTGWVDLAGLLSPEDRESPVDVLNGIAYDAESQHLLVTGKLWPKLFEIELVPLRAFTLFLPLVGPAHSSFPLAPIGRSERRMTHVMGRAAE